MFATDTTTAWAVAARRPRLTSRRHPLVARFLRTAADRMDPIGSARPLRATRPAGSTF